MSNEFVMVPRELLDRVLDPITSDGYINAKHEICALMAKPAEQHQGEPVEMEGATFMGEPNFHHSIEWYRTGISKHWKKICEQRVNIDALEKKLAEALGLLRIYESFPGYLIDHCEGDTIYEESLQYWLADHIKSLPASAEPSAPVERDERAEFESYAVTSAWLGLGLEEEMARDGEGYAETEVHTSWEAWKARAALDRKP